MAKKGLFYYPCAKRPRGLPSPRTMRLADKEGRFEPVSRAARFCPPQSRAAAGAYGAFFHAIASADR